VGKTNPLKIIEGVWGKGQHAREREVSENGGDGACGESGEKRPGGSPSTKKGKKAH